MKLVGNCQTTAMGILPHTEINQALRLALSLDIPFWPQLPKVSFCEDMYAQAAEQFPGVTLDLEEQRVNFSMDKFYQDLPIYVENLDDLRYFAISEKYSPVYHRFLNQDLQNYSAIRGQNIGPVSFGLKITDETKTPIIYHDEVRQVIFDYMAKKVTQQYRELQEKNENAFVWVDEPGLELIFMAFTGYPSERAREDYREFLQHIAGPKGVHLCGNPDWSFLLNLDLDILSIDILQWGHIFVKYKEELKKFLDRGGIISWGITPTLTEEVIAENVDTLLEKLEELWDALSRAGIDRRQVVRQAWLAPARCCLLNADGVKSVEKSFAMLRELSARLRDKYSLT